MFKKAILLALLVATVGCAAKKPQRLADRIESEIRFIVETEQAVETYYVAGDTHEAQLERLKAWLKEVDQIEVMGDPTMQKDRNILGETACFAYVDGTFKCMIVIDVSQSANTQYATLIHEAAHSFHGPSLETLPAEVIAETTSYLVTEAVGLRTQAQAMSYLGSAPAEPRYAVLLNFEDLILKYTQILICASSERKEGATCR